MRAWGNRAFPLPVADAGKAQIVPRSTADKEHRRRRQRSGYRKRDTPPFGVPGGRLADQSAALPTDPGTHLCAAVSATGGAAQRGPMPILW